VILLDVNVLVTAFRADLQGHSAVSRWLTQQLKGGQALGIPDIAATSFLRLVTNHRVFVEPSPLELATGFLDAVLEVPTASIVIASSRHWPTLRDLALGLRLRGNDLPDAHLAALALSSGAEIASLDRGLARFPGVRLVEPVLA